LILSSITHPSLIFASQNTPCPLKIKIKKDSIALPAFTGIVNLRAINKGGYLWEYSPTGKF
jgi:hypothetical protein